MVPGVPGERGLHTYLMYLHLHAFQPRPVLKRRQADPGVMRNFGNCAYAAAAHECMCQMCSCTVPWTMCNSPLSPYRD